MYMIYYERVQRVIEFIDNNIKNPISMDMIARVAGMSLTNLYRVFYTFTGFTLKDYIRKRRLTLAAYELNQTNNRILDIAIDYEFESQESFTRAFKALFGITPHKYRLLLPKIEVYERVSIMESLSENSNSINVTLEPVKGKVAEELMNVLNSDQNLRKAIASKKFEGSLEEFIEFGDKWCERTNSLCFAICVDGKAIGCISLSHINTAQKSAHFGFWVGSEYWKENYETEAFSQLLTIAKRYGITKIVAHKCDEREKKVLDGYDVNLACEEGSFYGALEL